jgi:MarC family integral membrane protein
MNLQGDRSGEVAPIPLPLLRLAVSDIAFRQSAEAAHNTLAWLTLYLADPIRTSMDKTGIHRVIRLMGLILATVAVQCIAAGLIQLILGLSEAT